MFIATRNDTLTVMKDFFFKIFYHTVGKIVRSFQRSLLVREREEDTLFYIIKQNAVKDSAQYAMENFSKAIQCTNRKELWQYCLSKIPKLTIVPPGGVHN